MHKTKISVIHLPLGHAAANSQDGISFIKYNLVKIKGLGNLNTAHGLSARDLLLIKYSDLTVIDFTNPIEVLRQLWQRLVPKALVIHSL